VPEIRRGCVTILNGVAQLTRFWLVKDDHSTMTPLASILHQKLTSLAATDLSTELEAKACVAAILRGQTLETLEVAYIRRAIAEHDRWSGQMAFPGGKFEEGDVDDFATAAREVEEEVGIVLSRSENLGRLHDIQARKRGSLLDFYIRPLVFYIDREVELKLDPGEVADFFWVPLARLQDPTRLRTYEWVEGDVTLSLPAIQLHGDPPLWGLTYLMTQDLLGRLL
jgi:8-oxo-dGTP pyrophosphatase MutT (NUDIX family)